MFEKLLPQTAFSKMVFAYAALFAMIMIVGGLTGGLTPPAATVAAQEQETVTITVSTVQTPGGCLITVEEGAGIVAGTVRGFTGTTVWELLPASSFEAPFMNGTTLYTVRWGLVQFDETSVFVFCEKNRSQDDLIIYVHRAEITSNEGLLDGEIVEFDINWSPGPTATPPSEFNLEGLTSWDYIGSSRSGPKFFTLTLLPN